MTGALGPEQSRILEVAGSPTALGRHQGALLVVGSGVAALGLAWAGQLEVGSLVALTLVAAIAATYAALRSMAHFVCGAIILRPLLDLTADPRGGGVGLTEAFGILVLGVSCAWLAVNRQTLVARLASPVAASMILFMIVMVFSTVGSPYPAFSMPITLRVATGIVMFLVVDVMLHVGALTVRGLVSALGLMAVVPLTYPLLGLLGVTVSHEKDGVTALKSVFFLSNNFAHFLVPIVVMSAAWAVLSRGWHRWMAAVVGVVATVELAATETRGAWLGLLVGIFVVGVLVSRRLLLAAAVAAVLIALLVPPVTSRITSLAGDPDAPRGESSLAWRFDQWETLFPLTAHSPLLGIGPDESVRLTDKQPHNDYLRALVETGVLGFLSFCALWLTIVRSGLVALRRIGGTALDVWRPRAPNSNPPHAEVQPAARATLVGAASAVIAAAAASSGENLIDNITFLWEVMPLAALLGYAATARWAQLAVLSTADEQSSRGPETVVGGHGARFRES